MTDTTESRGTPAAPRPRHRDRHGRGMRGPVAPPQVPLSASRADTFRDLVLDSVERLERSWPQLTDVEFMVLEVPPAEPADTVPLGIALPADRKDPARVIVYRRPIELRAKTRDERALLVHEVVVEQVADLLGLSPETVDPRYGEE
ncbi:metallopeptidase family protein [Streptomyces sp. NPDC048717]|uniref:metallopeptidase family protein n=1 Tax=unclassified Streptomyces TaxID=2593676 RepID=UPI00341DD2B0